MKMALRLAKTAVLIAAACEFALFFVGAVFGVIDLQAHFRNLPSVFSEDDFMRITGWEAYGLAALLIAVAVCMLLWWLNKQSSLRCNQTDLTWEARKCLSSMLLAAKHD
jgi:hypothetical protein